MGALTSDFPDRKILIFLYTCK